MSSVSSDTHVSPEPTPESSLDVRVSIEVLVNAIRLDGRRGTSVSVLPGQVVVLSHGGESADAGGVPEVYLAGEVATPNRLDKSAPCWAVQLKEFPGRVDVQARRSLAAISSSTEDTASLTLSFYIRLRDPLLLLRRTGAKWETEKDRDAFNRGIESDLKEWLSTLLESDLQIWSGDESSVLVRVLQSANDYLDRIGLRVDTLGGGGGTSGIIFRRKFPTRLYDLAFQFAQAERALRLGNIDVKTSGLSEEQVKSIASSQERAGVALFKHLMEAPPDVKQRLAEWLSQQGMPEAASFIRNLYGKVREREVALSEQVLLSAIRNPWLTQGEWLREISESPQTRFQKIDNRIRSLTMGSR